MFVFFSNSYRDVLERFILTNKGVRGYKSRLAEAAGCHNSYISQVLKGSVDLTLEQAMNLCSFWGFDAEKTDFFLDLLLRDRAGNDRLRDFYEKRLRRAREAFEHVSAEQKLAPALSPEAEIAYYATWYHAAVQVLARTREYASVERMGARLRLPASVIREVLRSLEGWRLLARRGDRWEEQEHPPHVSRSSPIGMINQTNWRQRAIFNIQSRDPDSLHLQQILAVRRADVPKLKARLLQCMEEARGSAGESAPEDGVVLLIDLFRL